MLDVEYEEEPTSVQDAPSVITKVTPGLFTVARVYGRAAADGDRQARQMIEVAALRFAAARLRKTAERGAEAWAATVDALADEAGR